VKEADIVDFVFHHDEAFEAEAECPSLVFFWIYAAGFEDAFMHHAGSHKFNPSCFFADAASFAVAEQA